MIAASKSKLVIGARGRRLARRGLVRASIGGIVGPVRNFWRCVRGVAAVEFGFIAPIMLIMLLGAVEVTRAVSIDRRFALVASTIADLVAREEQLSADDVDAIYEIVAQVMSPFDTEPLKISIVPVKGRGAETVSYVSPSNLPTYNNASQPGRCQAVQIGDGLIDRGFGPADSVIVVNATYHFSSLFLGDGIAGGNWEHQAFAKPRKRNCVDFEGPNSCVAACT